MLKDIVRELEAPSESAANISIARVREWIRSDDTDTLGATYGFLSNAGHVRRVSPPLEFDEVFDFMLRYYAFCLRTDPKSRWANSRYSAGWDLTGWFVQMWDEKRDAKYFGLIKSMLGKLYVEGNVELRKCIDNAVIEHLFERPPIRKFFEDWARDPELRASYDHGKLWVESGGKSPLTEPHAHGRS
ncbi:MAG: hypothetical protein WBV69_07330 [Candidatus Sulfotelmatobacter sp.]